MSFISLQKNGFFLGCDETAGILGTTQKLERLGPFIWRLHFGCKQQEVVYGFCLPSCGFRCTDWVWQVTQWQLTSRLILMAELEALVCSIQTVQHQFLMHDKHQ
jgi:hypothetical protein